VDWKKLFFSFEGRINRAKFWVVGLINVAVSLAERIAGDVLLDKLGPPTYLLTVIVVSVFTVWVGLAAGVKRLHDRAKSAWWMLVFFLLPAVVSLAAGLMDPTGLGIPTLALNTVAKVTVAWAIIELGCLKGTLGPNMYGADPLAAKAEATAPV
jgi:uncharacterized membrane protein YhaH (DUF805 family)